MTENIQIAKTFQTRGGSLVTVTGKLELEKEIWLDGHTDTIPTCEIYINVEVAGKGSQGGNIYPMSSAQKLQAPAGYNWVCGRLGLTDEQAEIIRSVRTELEQNPSWIAKQARIAQAEIEEAEYEEHVRRVNRMMNI
jgi:hypothetical protein